MPEYERDLLHQWVQEQSWPGDTKLKDPETYHMTILYSRVSHTSELARRFMYELNMDNWQHGVRVNGVEKFSVGDGARTVPVVVTVHGALLDLTVNHYLARARSLGLEPVEHGPYRPHITVAEVPPEAIFDPARELELPGPDSALGYPLKFMTEPKPVELHSFYQARKAGV